MQTGFFYKGIESFFALIDVQNITSVYTTKCFDCRAVKDKADIRGD